jgi:hypothetical protein
VAARLRAAAWSAGVVALGIAVAHAQQRAGEDLLLRFAGSDDTDALLREPSVRAELQALLGGELEHFLHNLNVRGSVDVVAGDLALDGNAPHGGTEEEAVLCIAIYDRSVRAAILSKGIITVYSRRPSYDAQTRCIKDWITQANSKHVDRMTQPANVRMAPPAAEGR